MMMTTMTMTMTTEMMMIKSSIQNVELLQALLSTFPALKCFWQFGKIVFFLFHGRAFLRTSPENCNSLDLENISVLISFA